MTVRSLVLLLLALDLVLLLWGSLRPSEPEIRSPMAPRSPGVERLRLLSEVDASSARSARDPRRSGGACFRTGPFVVRADAEALAARAAALGLGVRIGDTTVSAGPPDLQVHLPPLPSADAASRVVRELEALGIQGFVIPDGTYARAVSLGTFTRRDAAEARRAEVADLGYGVRIVELPRTRRGWRLLLRGEDASGIEGFLEEAVGDTPGLAAERVDCVDGSDAAP